MAKLIVNLNLPPELVGFVERLFGPVLELTDWGADYIRFARWKTGVKVFTRAQEIAKDARIEPKQVPVKFLVPFMEKCSLEDEESELVDLWAKLLVSAFDDFGSKHIVFVDILSQIGPSEAKTLRHMWERESKHGYDRLETLLDIYSSGGYYGSPKADEDRAGFLMMYGTGPSGDAQVDALREQNMYSLFVLERQNLIKIKTATKVGDDSRRTFVVHAVLTGLGFDFVQCCEKGISKKQ